MLNAGQLYDLSISQDDTRSPGRAWHRGGGVSMIPPSSGGYGLSTPTPVVGPLRSGYRTESFSMVPPSGGGFFSGGYDKAAAPAVAPGTDWQSIGTIAAVAGAASAAVGSFFSVLSQQNELKTQALSLEHEAAMSSLYARQAETEAQSIVEASHREIGALTLQYGAAEGTRRATTGGRGVRLDVGSTAEVEASAQVIEEMDVMAISVNAARAAGAARMRKVDAQNKSLLARTSARNIRRTAGDRLLPYSAAATSLLTSGANIGGRLATDRTRI